MALCSKVSYSRKIRVTRQVIQPSISVEGRQSGSDPGSGLTEMEQQYVAITDNVIFWFASDKVFRFHRPFAAEAD